MREEIKFRAKATNRSPGREYRTSYKNGDWVYGLLERHEFRLDDKCFPATMRNECGVSDIDVEECTLGQYTWRKDKNAVEIYEDDIVETQFGRLCKVVWRNNDQFCGWDLIPLEDKNKAPNIWEVWKSENLKVVGNIYDNPELLEEGK